MMKRIGEVRELSAAFRRVILCLVVVAALAVWTSRILPGQDSAENGPLSSPPAQGYTIYVTPHSHVDLEWYWTYDKTQVLVLKILGRAFDILQRDPHYAFTQDQLMAVKPFWGSLSGADRDLLRRMVKEGRFELTTGSYVQPEIAEPDYESLTRQYLLAKPWMESTFGTKILTSWNIDTYGQTIQMPQLSVAAGLRYFVFMRDVLPSLQASVRSPFYWQSPDGSKVLAYWLSGSYGVHAENVAAGLKTFLEHNSPGNDKILLPWGEDLYLPHEDSGEIARLVRDAGAKIGAPVKSVVVTTPKRYFEEVEKSGVAFPTYTYDFNPPLHIQDLRGLYGERPGAKRAERRAEDLLESSEKFNVIAGLYGQPYPAEQLRAAWKEILFNQDHDILPGSHTDEVEDAMNSRYSGAIEAGRGTLADALYRLSRRIHTANSGDFPFLTFNSLSFSRTEVVRYAPLFKEQIRNFRILDADGSPVPFRLVAASRRREDGPLSMAAVEFVASQVPGTGYRLYRIELTEGLAQPSSWHPARDEVSNDFFVLRLDAATGSITSIVDRRSGKELLDTHRYGGNELVLEEENDPDTEGMIHFTGGEIRASQYRPSSVTQMDDDLGTRLRIEGPFLGGERVQEIDLYQHLPRIDFSTELRGFPGHDGILVAVIPLHTSGALKNLYETHNAVTQRPDGIYDAQTWVDLADAEGGVALFNQGTGGHQIENGVIKLILLRSITHYTGYYTPSASEAGSHTFKYSLYSHSGDWAGAGVANQAHSFNSPLVVVSTDAHLGSRPAVHGFVSVESGRFEVTALKRAERGNDLVVRGHETEGKSGKVRLRFDFPVRAASLADLLEQPMRAIRVSGTVEFDCHPFEFITLRLQTGSGQAAVKAPTGADHKNTQRR